MADPDLEVIRYHSLHFEFLATGRNAVEHHAKCRENLEEPIVEDQDDEETVTRQELLVAYLKLLNHSLDMKNFLARKTDFSLMIRCLQYAGLPDGEAINEDDVTRKFREVYQKRPDGDFGDNDFKKGL